MPETEEKERQEQAKRELEQLSRLYDEVFSTPAGEAVLDDLTKRFFVGKTTYDPAADGSQIFFHEGCRFVMLWILGMAGLSNLEDLEELWRKAK